MNNRNRAAGFTLIEIIIVIAILAVLAGAMAPLAVNTIDRSREDKTTTRQKLIYQAIFGNPMAQGSGFLSDTGSLPSQGLTELSIRPTTAPTAIPPYTLRTYGVGMGWRGPYLLEGVDTTGRPLDGWGMPMNLTLGQIRSSGLDRTMNSADDILYPAIQIPANNAYGSINITVMVWDTALLIYRADSSAIVTVFFAQNGSEQSTVMPRIGAPGSGVYAINNIPQGIHAIDVIDGTMKSAFTVYCPGGGSVQQMVTLR